MRSRSLARQLRDVVLHVLVKASPAPRWSAGGKHRGAVPSLIPKTLHFAAAGGAPHLLLLRRRGRGIWGVRVGTRVEWLAGLR